MVIKHKLRLNKQKLWNWNFDQLIAAMSHINWNFFKKIESSWSNMCKQFETNFKKCTMHNNKYRNDRNNRSKYFQVM